jgi:hypothetical protein
LPGIGTFYFAPTGALRAPLPNQLLGTLGEDQAMLNGRQLKHAVKPKSQWLDFDADVVDGHSLCFWSWPRSRRSGWHQRGSRSIGASSANCRRGGSWSEAPLWKVASAPRSINRRLTVATDNEEDSYSFLRERRLRIEISTVVAARRLWKRLRQTAPSGWRVVICCKRPPRCHESRILTER